jgi:hypothetical protein
VRIGTQNAAAGFCPVLVPPPSTDERREAQPILIHAGLFRSPQIATNAGLGEHKRKGRKAAALLPHSSVKTTRQLLDAYGSASGASQAVWFGLCPINSEQRRRDQTTRAETH